MERRTAARPLSVRGRTSLETRASRAIFGAVRAVRVSGATVAAWEVLQRTTRFHIDSYSDRTQRASDGSDGAGRAGGRGKRTFFFAAPLFRACRRRAEAHPDRCGTGANMQLRKIRRNFGALGPGRRRPRYRTPHPRHRGRPQPKAVLNRRQRGGLYFSAIARRNCIVRLGWLPFMDRPVGSWPTKLTKHFWCE